MLIDRLYSGINETKQRELELLVSCLHKSQLITDNLQYNGIKITKQCSDVNCVKSIRIQGCPGGCIKLFINFLHISHDQSPLIKI